MVTSLGLTKSITMRETKTGEREKIKTTLVHRFLALGYIVMTALPIIMTVVAFIV